MPVSIDSLVAIWMKNETLFSQPSIEAGTSHNAVTEQVILVLVQANFSNDQPSK